MSLKFEDDWPLIDEILVWKNKNTDQSTFHKQTFNDKFLDVRSLNIRYTNIQNNFSSLLINELIWFPAKYLDD